MDILEKRRLIMPMELLPISSVSEQEVGSQAGQYVSLERYWRDYYNDLDFVYEWNNGYLEEKPVSKKETKNRFHWLVKVLEIFLDVHPIAEIYGLETGFKLQLPHNKTVVRRPDLGIVKKDNPVPFFAATDNYTGIFDMCIEALSDSNKTNIERDTKHKKEEYEEGGVTEYYILDGIGNRTRFYSMNQWGLYEEIEPIDGDIIVSQVLPGFQFRISDLVSQPPLSQLVLDEVYRGYVMVKYQSEKAAKERERERAERERERAEREKERAEKAERAVIAERQEKEQARLRAEREKERAERERERAEIEKAEKERERQRAEKAERAVIAERQQKEQARLRAEKAEEEAKRLIALLQAQGISLD